ncbi:response regulator [Povalibacter sp.]|uniref:response regulator n=1 Tax=Povalibacter sp. TaxID=1962978 RepID=UPI002F3F746C
MKSASENSLPRRALIVDNDPATLESTAALLKLQGFAVTTASDGAEALTVFARDWYPLVIVSRNIPTLDGIEIASRLRVIALAPVYVIMLTGSTDARDHELGYCAGVDQYLLMQNYPGELVGKAEAGLVAVRRRRSSRTDPTDELAIVDLENGAHTARHLVGRLHAEIAQSARSRGILQILSVELHTDDDQMFARLNLGTSTSNALLQAVHDAIRPKLDWVARLPAPAHTCRIAVVMPESSPVDAPAVEQRIRNAFVHWNTESALSDVRLSCGLATLARNETPPTALDFLGQAERNRRGKDNARTGIFHVQRESVA